MYARVCILLCCACFVKNNIKIYITLQFNLVFNLMIQKILLVSYVRKKIKIIIRFHLIFNFRCYLTEIIISEFCLLIIFMNCTFFVKSFYVIKF